MTVKIMDLSGVLDLLFIQLATHTYEITRTHYCSQRGHEPDGFGRAKAA